VKKSIIKSGCTLVNSRRALVPHFFTPIKRTSGSCRVEIFCELTNRYLKVLSFREKSSSVSDTILTTLPNIICVSSGVVYADVVDEEISLAFQNPF
jgi:hypothetical protein